MKHVFLLFCFTATLSNTLAQEASVAAIDRQDIKYIVKYLSADSLQGRETRSAGERRAAEFIARQFKAQQVFPAFGDSYFQPYTLRRQYWGEVYLIANGKNLQNFDRMMCLGGDAINEERAVEVIFVGDGKVIPPNVEGKMVMVLLKNLRAYYDVAKQVERKKALGVIIANAEGDQFESLKRNYEHFVLQKRLGFPSDDEPEGLDSLRIGRVIAVPRREAERIMGASIKKMVRAVDHDMFPTSTVRLKLERIDEAIETSNVGGMLRGTSSGTIVVSAHYDHLGIHGEKIFHGADDNASGIAALLTLAKEFQGQELNYSVLFLATSGEEAGLLGSSYFVNSKLSDTTQIICNLNIDMIGRIDDKHETNSDYLYCIGSDIYQRLDTIIRKADASYDGCTLDFSLNNASDPAGFYHRSDQYNFHERGIPALQFFSGLHPDYHHATDTAEKINYPVLRRRIELISSILKLIQLSLWN